MTEFANAMTVGLTDDVCRHEQGERERTGEFEHRGPLLVV
jgi:hypothetical protein